MFTWPEGSKLLSLMHRIDEADPMAQPLLRSTLAQRTTWEHPLGLTSRTEEAYWALIGERKSKQRETFVKRRNAFEVAWGIENATTLEWLLIKLISAGYLRVHLADYLATAQNVQAVDCLPGLRDRARGQMQAAVKNLDTVKKLPSAGTQESADSRS
jgi:hypothetical protein